MTGRRDLSHLPDWPAAMGVDAAAAYVGLAPATFLAAVERDGITPIWLSPGRKVWRRTALDRWLDSKAGAAPSMTPESAWDHALGGDGATALS